MKLMTSIIEKNAFLSSIGHNGDDDDEDDAKSVMLDDLEICNSGSCQNAEPVHQCTSAGHINCDTDDDNESVMLEDLESLQSVDNNGKAVSGCSQVRSEDTQSSVEPIDYSQKAVSSWPWLKHAEETDDDNKSIMLEDLETFYPVNSKQLDDKSGMLLHLHCDNDNTSGNEDGGEDATDDDTDDEFYAIGQIDDDDDYLPPGKHKEPKVRVRTLKQNQYKSQKKPAKRRTRRHTPQLWVFLLNCLLDPDLNPSVIEWQDRRRGIFRLKNTKQIAQIWGQRLKKDHKKPMNYEKFSRAIRYYYHKKVILSGPGRLTYQFGPKATGWRQVLRAAT